MLKLGFHGEATVKPIEELPKGAIQLKHTGDLIIAASSTVGHHHRIYCNENQAQLYERDGVLYLKVDEQVELTCRDKHDATVINPGIYEIGAQREWDYLTGMAQHVAD